jgi:DNA-binding transcriptional LysR family regulator
MLFDIPLLRTLVAIADTASFTRAANQVHLTQSAISLHVKRLEERVGHRLIERNAHRLLLTAEGEILLGYARRILTLHDEAETRLGVPEASGTIRFGAPECFAPQLLSALLAQFHRRYPSISLDVTFELGSVVTLLFEKGQLDVAIIDREIGSHEGTVLWRDSRVWASNLDFRLQPDQAVPLAVLPSTCSWRRLVLETLDRAERPWTIVLQSSGVAGLVAAVEAGLAVSIFAGGSLPASLRVLGAAENLPPIPPFEYAVIQHANASPAAKYLTNSILDWFQATEAQSWVKGTGVENLKSYIYRNVLGRFRARAIAEIRIGPMGQRADGAESIGSCCRFQGALPRGPMSMRKETPRRWRIPASAF